MSEPKNQHYVPQTYLKRFSVSIKKTQKVFTLHKDKRKVFFTPISNTGAEKHFYTVENYEEKYQWENIYSQLVEPIMGNVLTSLISYSDNALVTNYSKVITDELKMDLSFTIICQLLRGKQSRDYQRNIYSDVAPLIIEKLRKLEIKLDDSKESVMEKFISDKKYFKDVSFVATLDQLKIEKYVRILLSKCFVIYRITGNGEFITSDNPVMFMNSNTMNVKPFSNGLSDHRTVVFFPLSPKLLVVIYSPNTFFGGMMEFDGKVVFIKESKEGKFICNHNRKQFEQCFNQVYSRNEIVLKSLL